MISGSGLTGSRSRRGGAPPPAAYHFRLAAHPFSAPELVQNPAAATVVHAVAEDAALRGWRMPLQLLSGVGGILLSLATPPATAEIAGKITGTALCRDLISSTEIFACVGAVGWTLCVARKSSRADRWIAAAMMAAVAVLAGMVVAARAEGLPRLGILWPPKYQCVPYCWAVLTASFLADRTLSQAADGGRTEMRWMLVVAGLAFWSLMPQWFVEKSLAIPGPWHFGGRYKNFHDAGLRRRDFRTFQGDMVELAQLAGRKKLPLPPVSLGWNTYPYLEMGSGPTGSNYLCSDLIAIAPITGIDTSTVPRADVPVSVIDAIAKVPRLDRLFRARPDE